MARGDVPCERDCAERARFRDGTGRGAARNGSRSIAATPMGSSPRGEIRFLRRCMSIGEPPNRPEHAALDLHAMQLVVAGDEEGLRQLYDRQRRTLHVAFFEGLTYPEIAERDGVSLGTVKSRAARALAALRSALRA